MLSLYGRKEVQSENKRYFYSNEYLSKIRDSYSSQPPAQSQNIQNNVQNMMQNNTQIPMTVNPSTFQKIPPFENTKISHEQPMVVFKQPFMPGGGAHSFECQMQRELGTNNYITDGGYKKKITKFSRLDSSQYKNNNNNLRRSHCVSTSNKYYKRMFDFKPPPFGTAKSQKRPLSSKNTFNNNENNSNTNIGGNNTAKRIDLLKRKDPPIKKDKDDLINNIEKSLDRYIRKKKIKEKKQGNVITGNDVISQRKIDALFRNNAAITPEEINKEFQKFKTLKHKEKERREKENKEQNSNNYSNYNKDKKGRTKNMDFFSYSVFCKNRAQSIKKNNNLNNNKNQNINGNNNTNRGAIRKKRDRTVYKQRVKQFEYIDKINEVFEKLHS